MPRHLLDHGVAAQQAGHPFATAGVEHLALAALEIDDHAVAALDLVEVLVARAAVQRLGSEAALLVIEEAGRQVGILLDLRGHADRQYLHAGRRAALAGRFRQAVADDMVEAVDLVAENVAVGAEQVAVVEAGAGERPVLGPVDRESRARRAARSRPSRHRCRAVALSPKVAAPGRPISGRLPGIGGAPDIAAAIGRVLGAGAVFVADLAGPSSSSLVCHMKLPAKRAAWPPRST